MSAPDKKRFHSHFVFRCECGRMIDQCPCPAGTPKSVRVAPGPCDVCLSDSRAKVRDEIALMSGNSVAAEFMEP